jgi:colanic acid/amylovoran biosynthesis glycosyltransferase
VKIIKNLIILTHAFPFAPPSEQFLQSELESLSLSFDKVFLIPTSHSAHTSEKREIVGKNVYTKRLNRGKVILEIFSALFPAVLMDPYFYRELFEFKKRGLLFNKVAISSLLLNFINSYLIYKKVEKIVEDLNFTKSDKIVIYSYWFSHLTKAAIKLKVKLLKNGYNNVFAISRAHGSSDVFIAQKMNDYKVELTYINNNIDKIFSISDIGSEYLEKIGFNPRKLLVNRLGVKDGMNFSLKKNSEHFKIVSCSYMSSVKRIDLIVEALADIDDLNIEWIHFGDGPLFEEIKNKCNKKIKENIKVTFLGNKRNEEILDFYRKERPNVFINVSSIEGIPVSIMEAISFGIPIIATNVGGNSEICKEGINGILIPKDFEVSLLTKKIKEILLLNGKEYSKLCINSRNIYENYFDSQKNYEVLSKYIQHL